MIAISDQVVEHLKGDFGVKASKIHLVISGVDLEAFSMIQSDERVEKRKQLGVGDKIVLGMVARLSDVKGQDVLIQALPKILDRFPQALVVLAGKGKFKPELERLISQLKLDGKVWFLENEWDVRSYLCAFDLYLNPSRQEGLGISVIEAQACGIPVVASRVGGLPVLVQEAKTGFLVSPEQPNELASKVVQVLNSPEKMDFVRIQAREFIEKNFSDTQMVEKTISVYRNFVK